MNSISDLVVQMRDLYGRLKSVEDSGVFVRAEEVTISSFVQVMYAMPLVPGTKEPVAWQYNQFWIDKSSDEIKNSLVGAYLNERIGFAKVIGIYEQVK